LEHYGIPTPGEAPVDSNQAIDILRSAADGGINFFDTARGYGTSERLLGEALASNGDCIVSTKVALPEGVEAIPTEELRGILVASLDASRRALRREVLDIVQIHNATVAVLESGRVVDCLERAREEGKLRWIGASVYGPETALAAIRTGKIQVLQLALSVLDQRMCSEVLPEAEKAGVGILLRSALLKGALTKRAQWLPESLRRVAEASARVVRELDTTWDALPTVALRFCLSVPAAQTVLVGVRGQAELEECLAAEAAGRLPANLLKIAYSLALDNEQLLNPSLWRLAEGDTEQDSL
jgi:aryl-alcohol dehydrogenase-like predicted oxidoreductase